MERGTCPLHAACVCEEADVGTAHMRANPPPKSAISNVFLFLSFFYSMAHHIILIFYYLPRALQKYLFLLIFLHLSLMPAHVLHANRARYISMNVKLPFCTRVRPHNLHASPNNAQNQQNREQFQMLPCAFH